jgi:hypothetical protein
MSPAPIALFIYKRAAHLRRTLESLAACPEASRSALHIFADAPKFPEHAEAVAEARAVAHAAAGFASVTIIEQGENWGLARSIIGGVTDMCEKYGRVIVVEDDLVVGRDFLRFLNEGLDRYAEDERVMQISGYAFPVDVCDVPGPYFLPQTCSWGWATWARAWAHFDSEMSTFSKIANDRQSQRRFNLDGAYDYWGMAQDQRRGVVDSWAIRWQLSLFGRDGVALYPEISLVENAGVDGTGTHGAGQKTFQRKIADNELGVDIRWPKSIEVDDAMFSQVKQFLRRHRPSWRELTAHSLRRIWRGIVDALISHSIFAAKS